MLYTVQVLGGYRYTADPEKDIALLAVNHSGVNISYMKFASLLSIWVPVVCNSLVDEVHCNDENPYKVCLCLSFFSITTSDSSLSSTLSLMLVLSVTLWSPLLALSIIICSHIPIQTGLFDVHIEPPSAVLHTPPVEMLTG